MSAAPDAPIAQRGREAFREGLRELGYVEGQNVAIEYRFAEGRLDRLADLAAELVAAQVEVIVAAPSPSAVAAKRATGTIPIVMISVGDPEGLGLVASLARPAGNVTGLSFGVGMQTFGKALELLAEAVPGVRRIAILSNFSNPTHSLVKRELDAAARSVGVLLPRFDVGRVEDFEGAFAGMVDAQVGALMVITDALFISNAVRVADLCTKSRLPSMHGIREGVEAGGLMSYGAAIGDQWRRAAGYVDRILKGAKPAELPVEQPTKFELVINARSAAALGLTIPPTLLARADEVIE
jgi:putative ABC transport system substrate-binding protein